MALRLRVWVSVWAARDARVQCLTSVGEHIITLVGERTITSVAEHVITLVGERTIIPVE
jgi:hypothetical protein